LPSKEKMPHIDFKKLPIPHESHLELCPVCGSGAELWQYSDSVESPTRKLVRCTNYDGFGPQVREVFEGCLLCLPPHEFYKATVHEAVTYWNEYALALAALRKDRMNDGKANAKDSDTVEVLAKVNVAYLDEFLAALCGFDRSTFGELSFSALEDKNAHNQLYLFFNWISFEKAREFWNSQIGQDHVRSWKSVVEPNFSYLAYQFRA
jgi:hypothetical protein